MKFAFKYWDNSKQWHGKLLFEYYGNDILEADKAFKTSVGIDATKNGNIGCAIEKIKHKCTDKV